MYEDHVLEHYSRPYHKGLPPRLGIFHRLFIESEKSDICGDEVTFWVRVLADGTIHSLWWEGEGCCFSQAAASMVAGHFAGETLTDVHEFTESDMLKLFAAEVPKARTSCVTLALDSLKQLPERL